MAFQKRAAQPLGSPTTRRPVNKMFRGGNPDFYSSQPIEKAKRKFTSGTTNRFYDRPLQSGAYDQEAFGRIANENMMRMMQQRQMPQMPMPELPMSGAVSGFGSSHDPHPQPGTALFGEKTSDDINYLAAQRGGNPWFDPHQQATRFAETFGAESIRKKPDPSPFGR